MGHGLTDTFSFTMYAMTHISTTVCLLLFLSLNAVALAQEGSEGSATLQTIQDRVEKLDEKVDNISIGKIKGAIVTMDGRHNAVKRSLNRKAAEEEQSASKDPPSFTYHYGGNKCRGCKDSVNLVYDFHCKKFYHWVEPRKKKCCITERSGSYKPLKRLSQFSVDHGQEFRLKVVNINRYNYGIGFVADEVEFGSEEPRLFKELFTGSGGSVLDGLIQSMSFLGAQQTDKMDSDQEKFIEDLKNFKEKYDLLLEKRLEAYRYCAKGINNCCSENAETTFTKLSESLTDLKIDYADMMKGLNKQVADKEKTAITSKNAYDECASREKRVQDSLKSAKTDAEKEKLRKILEGLNCTAKKTKAETDASAFSDAKNERTLIEKLWESAIKPTEEDLMKLVLFRDNLVRDHFSYTSPPVYATGNLLSIGLRISPDTNGLAHKWATMPLERDSIGLDIFVRWKWNVNFSSGPFGVFGGIKRSKEHGWVAEASDGVVTDSSFYRLTELHHRPLPFGLAAFANIGTKPYSWFGFGTSVGAGISLEARPRPVYMLGTYASFGERAQFNINVGLSLMEVNKGLAGDLHLETDYTSKQDINYETAIAYGGFVSVSYTFLTLNKRRSGRSGTKK